MEASYLSVPDSILFVVGVGSGAKGTSTSTSFISQKAPVVGLTEGARVLKP